jgi:hypothetical protein
LNLLRVLGRVGGAEILFYAFDLLWIDGEDMRGLLLKSNGCISTASARYDGDLSIHLLIPNAEL